jgi:hypothetical protein
MDEVAEVRNCRFRTAIGRGKMSSADGSANYAPRRWIVKELRSMLTRRPQCRSFEIGINRDFS